MFASASASVSILVLLSTAVGAWKVKLAGAFPVAQTCVVKHIGAAGEWTISLKDASSPILYVLASFSQAPTSCEFKQLGGDNDRVAQAVVTGADKGMLTVRVLNTCQSSSEVRITTLCGVTTVLGATSTAPQDVTTSSCNADCSYKETTYCESLACAKTTSCNLFEVFASFSFPVNVTQQSAACVIGGKPPTFDPTTAFTVVGMPSGNPTDDSLSTCCAARGTGPTAPASNTVAAAGTKNNGAVTQVLLSVVALVVVAMVAR